MNESVDFAKLMDTIGENDTRFYKALYKLSLHDKDIVKNLELLSMMAEKKPSIFKMCLGMLQKM
jgi:hypothetical protein